MKYVAIVINLIGLTVFSGVFLLGATATGLSQITPYALCGATLWLGLYVCLGIRQVGQNEFMIIERFGEYYRTAEAGLTVLCFPGLVDSVPENGGRFNYYWHRTDLYETDNKIDFTDASAGLKAQVWWRVKLKGEDPDAPKKYTYSVKETEQRIKEIADGTLRVLLQGKSVDDASKNLVLVTQTVMADILVRNALDDMGVELDPNKGVVVTDIILSENIIAAREEALRGSREATKQKLQGAGYANAILAIQEEAARGRRENPNDPNSSFLVKPKVLSFKEAREIYERQRNLETLQAKAGNIHFVSPDVKGALIALGGEERKNT